MIDLINVINASKGQNAHGEPNSAFSISEQIIDSSNDVKVLKTHVLTTPEINVVINGDYVMFDCKFPSTSSPELRILWNYLEGFGKKQNEYFDKIEIPVLNFVVMPLEFSGKYSYALVNPICWTLQPPNPSAPVDTVRILFEKEALNLFTTDDINEKEIEAEIEREEYEQTRLEEIERKREAEHQEYLDKLNRHFNPHE